MYVYIYIVYTYIRTDRWYVASLFEDRVSHCLQREVADIHEHRQIMVFGSLSLKLVYCIVLHERYEQALQSNYDTLEQARTGTPPRPEFATKPWAKYVVSKDMEFIISF